ncbi:phosphotransferase [Baia soyae]|uniref:Aminoglycoside phosphotransferase domain-containing protein n=1 Tax=Baia soyae TaxID=1544746 RepID=A0A4R2RK55_9BACL|nr:phosphotransferase [Baia soyae]TCP64240.1 hypothetical protein EDD57_1425 [Baia soyae]
MLSQDSREVAEQLDQWTGEIHFTQLLEYHYGFQVLSARPIAGVIYLETDQGPYGCKRIKKSELDSYKLMVQVAPWMESLSDPVMEIPMPRSSLKNEKHVLTGFARNYVIYPWIHGESMSWNHEQDWLDATVQLASFHKQSAEWEPEKKKMKWTDPSEIQKEEAHKHEIYTLAAKWTEIPNQVDITLSRMGTYYQSLLESIQEYDEKISGQAIREQSRVNGKLCHNNCSRKNWIRTENHNKAQLIDWNQLSHQVRTKDVGDWLLTAYRSTGSKELITRIIKQYDQVHPVEEEEHALIYSRLIYPDHYLFECKQIFEEQIYFETTACKKLTEAKEITSKKIAFASWYVEMMKQEYNKKVPTLYWVHL